jgi:hypothetical protein
MRGTSPRMTTAGGLDRATDSSEGREDFPRTALRFRGND